MTLKGSESVDVTTNVTTDAPFQEHEAAGPELLVAEAERALHPRLPDRYADGTMRPGHPGPALKSGAYSRLVREAALPEQAEVRAMLADAEAAIVADVGGIDAISTMKRDLIGEYQTLWVVARHLSDNIVARGPLTPKGKQRAALTAYLSVVDRLTRLAGILGLDRKARDIGSMSAQEWIAHERKQAEATP